MKRVQFIRHTTAGRLLFTGLIGEITVDTDKLSAVIHDGVTAGGWQLARADLTNVAAVTQAVNGYALATDKLKLDNAQALSGGSAGGTADAITVTLVPVPSGLVNQMAIIWQATATNATTTPTFSPNSLTAHTLVNSGGSALGIGAIVNGNHYLSIYDLVNTRWVNFSLDIFLGDAGSGGARGLVKAPAVGDAAKALGGNASWVPHPVHVGDFTGADTITCSFTGATLFTGLIVYGRIVTPNTGAAMTLQFGSAAAKTVVTNSLGAPPVGATLANMTAFFMYNATTAQFTLINAIVASGLTSAQVAALAIML